MVVLIIWVVPATCNVARAPEVSVLLFANEARWCELARSSGPDWVEAQDAVERHTEPRVFNAIVGTRKCLEIGE